MSEAVITNYDIWINAMAAALDELATEMLGFEGSTIAEMNHRLPDRIKGAHIAMISLHDSLNIGLIADDKDCAALAKALLCTDGDEEISEEDIKDSMGEMVNIIAGGVKRRLIDDIPTIKIGLPIFFNGYMAPGKNEESSVIDVTIGSIAAKLYIITDSGTRDRS